MILTPFVGSIFAVETDDFCEVEAFIDIVEVGNSLFIEVG